MVEVIFIKYGVKYVFSEEKDRILHVNYVRGSFFPMAIVRNSIMRKHNNARRILMGSEKRIICALPKTAKFDHIRKSQISLEGEERHPLT